jgi:transmembrane sensor
MSHPTDTLTSIRDTAARWLVRRERGLSADEQQSFTAWMNSDSRHAAAVSQLESTWGSLDRPLQAGAADAVLQRLHTFVARRRQRRFAATAMVFAVLCGAVYFSQLHRPETATAGVKVLLAEKRTLPDGSVAELNGAVLDVDFATRLRRVVLRQGEAHFQVVEDLDRPFVVEAAGIEVRAVGTAFSIQVGRNAVEVLVTAGRVAVEKEKVAGFSTAVSRVAPETTNEALFLDAGHNAVIDLSRPTVAGSNIATVSEAEVAERLAWRSPRLEFTGVPLSDAIALMNQHSAAPGRPSLRLVIDDPVIGREEVSGLFRADKVETFIRVLENGFGLKIEPRGENERVLRRAR